MDIITSLPWYVLIGGLVVILIAIITLIKTGYILDWGKKKLFRRNDQCGVCRLQVHELIREVIATTTEITMIRMIRILNDQLRHAESLLTLFTSICDDEFHKVLDEKISKQQSSDQTYKSIAHNKDGKIVYSIFLVFNEDCKSFIQRTILDNHFTDKDYNNLKIFTEFKCKLMQTKLEERIRQLYPDTTDLMFESDELVQFTKDKIYPKLVDMAFSVFLNAQSIQIKYNERIKELENGIQKRREDFDKCSNR